MTNDIKQIEDITTKLGKKVSGIGNIFWKTVDFNNPIEVSEKIENSIFDVNTHNFHLLPIEGNDQMVGKYISLTEKIRKQIIDVLKRQMNAKEISHDEYLDFTKIKEYEEDRIYIYGKGGKTGTFSKLGTKKNDDENQKNIKAIYREYGYNAIFRYIPCIVNGRYYTINFMRFYVDTVGKINCIYQKLQFDYSECAYVNKNAIAYPDTYRGMTIDRIDQLAKNEKSFCFNPKLECDEANSVDIAELFEVFHTKTERIKKKGKLYITKKNSIEIISQCFLKLDRVNHCLELYQRAEKQSILYKYYSIRLDFDSSNYIMYEKVKSMDCIYGGEKSPTPTGIFQVEEKSTEEYISGYYSALDQVKFFGYLVIFEDYFIHSDLYAVGVTKETMDENEPVNKRDTSTSGCIRVSQEDLDWLLENVEVGTMILM